MTKAQIIQRNQSLKSLRDEGLTASELSSLLASRPAMWAEILTELEGQKVILEPFQIRFLNDRSTYRISCKARQIGYSTTIAIETCHAASTKSNYNANIVSTTQDEAADKLKIAGMLWASIPEAFREIGFKPVKYKDAQEVLAFHMQPHTSTITSKPGTSAIRGGKKDMYYDEAAFINQFPTLYQAGLPAITRGEGRISVISTPFGESGLYHELWNDPSWSHHKVPWWESRFMVRGAINPDGTPNYEPVYEAIGLAPEMDTLSRVERFGSDKINNILHVGLRDDLIAFQTEYECMFVDEAEAYFPWDLIISCKDDSLRIYRNYPEAYEPLGDITIGVDLAKERDSTVMTVIDNYDIDGVAMHKVVYIYVTQQDYADQFVMLKNLVQASKARRVSIDATGPGQMFYEKASREGFGRETRIEGISFTNEKKEGWATKFKADLQDKKVSYPNHSELLNQIHGIKRTKTVTSLFRFAGEKDDYFWSLMLGIYGAGTRPTKFYRIGG